MQYQMEVVCDVIVNVHNDLSMVRHNVIDVGKGIGALQKSVISHRTGKNARNRLGLFQTNLLTPTDDRQQEILEWLSAPGPSRNHHAACHRRQQATGLWLIDGQKLAGWKIKKPSLLWLHGIRDCYKRQYMKPCGLQ